MHQDPPTSNAPGWAPEIGQAKIREEEEARRKAAESSAPVVTIFNTEWWVAKETGKDPEKMIGQDLQNFLNETPGTDPHVCKVGDTGWTLASTNGFSVTEAEKRETVGEVGVDLAKSPEEEALETLPDNDLFQLARDRAMLQFDAAGQPDRAATVKVLAAAGVQVV